jgi:hypothetical protein
MAKFNPIYTKKFRHHTLKPIHVMAYPLLRLPAQQSPYSSTRFCVLGCFQWWHAGHACGHQAKRTFLCPLAHAQVLAIRRSLPLFPLGKCTIQHNCGTALMPSFQLLQAHSHIMFLLSSGPKSVSFTFSNSVNIPYGCCKAPRGKCNSKAIFHSAGTSGVRQHGEFMVCWSGQMYSPCGHKTHPHDSRLNGLQSVP